MSNAKAQVLIVEDEPEIAELIEFHAERAGMQARKVHSGRIALADRARPASAPVLDEPPAFMEPIPITALA